MKSTRIYILRARAPRQYTGTHEAALLPDETLDVVRGGLNIDIPDLLPSIPLPDLSRTPLNPLAQLLVKTLT